MDKKVEVINKFGKTLAIFTSEDEETVDRMIDPVVTLTQNSDNVFSFSISEKSQKWEDIKSIENLYVVDGHVYSPLFADSYNHVVTEDGQNLIQVKAYERQKMLEKIYVTAWNSETGFEKIDTFMVVILSKGNLPLTNKRNGIEANVDPGDFSVGSAGYIMKGLLYGTGWEVGIVDVEGYFDFETEQLSVYENLLRVQEMFGGILIFDSVNKIVHLREESNYISYRGYEIRHRKNLKDMNLEIDNNIVTRLYVFGEAGLNISKVNYEKIYLENYSYSNETYEGIATNTDIFEADQLKKWGERKLLDLCAPRKILTANIAYLTQKEGFEQEDLRLNDSVKVYYTDVEYTIPYEGVEIVETEIEISDVDSSKKSYLTISGNAVQATSILPDEYQQVEYITSSGSQYINTGFIANQDTSVEIKVKPSSVSPNAGIYCSRTDLNSNTYSLIIVNSNFRHDYKNAQADTGVRAVANTEYVIYSNKNNLYINNELAHTSTYGEFQPTYNMLLLATNANSQTANGNYFKGNLYYCKIWDNETLVRNLVPCYRKSDNVIGLYDLVNDEFYTNAGTGNFTKSTDLTLPIPDFPQDVQVVEGEFNVAVQGKNLINPVVRGISSGITPTSNTDGSISYSGTATSATAYLQDWVNCNISIGNYVFSISKALIDYNARIQFTYEDSTTSSHNIPKPDTDMNITLSKNAIKYRLVLRNLTVNTLYNDTLYFQLEKGSTTTKYQKYYLKTYPMALNGPQGEDTDIQLAKVGPYRDYIFRNSPDNPNYSKTLDLDGFYVRREIGKKVLADSISWNKTGLSFQAHPFTPGNTDYAICNMYKFNPTHVSASTAFNNYEFGYNQSGVLTIRDDRFETAAEFQEFVSNHEITIYYPLETPVIEKIELDNAWRYYTLLSSYKIDLPDSYAHIYSSTGIPCIDLRYNVVEANVDTDIETELLRVTSIDYPVFNPSSATVTLGDVTQNTNDIFKKISNTTNAFNSGLIDADTVKNYLTGKTVTQDYEIQHTQNMSFEAGINSLNVTVSNISTMVDDEGNKIKDVESQINTLELTTDGLKNTLQKQGGSNLLRNSSASFGNEFWRGEVVQTKATEIIENFLADSCFYLQNGTLGQTISVPNGDYYIGFKYKKLVELANCTVTVNGSTVELTAMDYTTEDKFITVTDHVIDIEIKSNTDNSCYIGDIIIVPDNKQQWSPNANEIYYDTVEIGKGIQVKSNTANSYTRIDADGNRIYNKASGEVVTELTDEGMITNRVYCEQLTAAGVLHQTVIDKYNDEQAWLTKI